MNLRGLFKSIQRRLGQGGACPHELAFALVLPWRRLLITPHQLVERLTLDPAARVLELGPGAGYFSADVAHSIPKGRLLLVDIQPQMLTKSRKRLARAGVNNAEYVCADATHLPLADGTCDVALMVAVLGEVPDPAACLRELYRVLRPGGLFSNTEQPIDPDFLPLDQVRALAEGAGLVLERVLNGGALGGWSNYTANFRKP